GSANRWSSDGGKVRVRGVTSDASACGNWVSCSRRTRSRSAHRLRESHPLSETVDDTRPSRRPARPERAGPEAHPETIFIGITSPHPYRCLPSCRRYEHVLGYVHNGGV